jgi:tyrocidine synthetase-3
MESTHKLNKKNIEAISALTSMQEGMLFYYLQDPKNERYLEQLRLELIGEVDTRLLREAWDQVVQRHGILRTCFRWDQVKQPVQVVFKTMPVNMRVLDRPADRQFLQRDRAEGVALESVPFRVTLCRHAREGSAMVLTFHHILLDGWSTGIVLKDFFTVYNSLAEGKTVESTDGSHYTDFVKAANSQDQQAQAAFWKEYLQDYDPPASIGQNCGQTDTPTYNQIEVELDRAIIERIDALCGREKITSAALYYSAWGILLQTYANTRDVVFGTTVSGRSLELEGIRHMVGLMIQTPPLRVRCDGDETLGQLMRRTTEQMMERQKVEHTSLVKIPEFAGLAAGAPLFQTIVVVENYPLETMLAQIDGPLRVGAFYMDEIAHYDLSLGIALHAGQVRLRFQFRDGVLTELEVRDLAAMYLEIVRQMAHEPEKQVSALNLLSSRQQETLQAGWRQVQTGVKPDQSLPQLFARQADTTPDGVAVVFGQHHITYSELQQKIQTTASAIISRGAGPGAVTALKLARSIKMIVALLAAMEAGNTVLPLDPSQPPRRIDYMIQDSGASLVIDEAWLAAAGKPDGPCHQDADMISFPPHQENAYIIYTSGSTGRPKGVVVKHSGVANIVSWFARRYKVGPGRRVLQMTTITFDPAMEQIFSTLLSGATLYLPPKGLLSMPEDFTSFINSRHIEIVNFVPQGLQELLPRGECPDSLRAVISGGEALSDTIKERLLGDGYPLYNHYGPTETTIDAISGKCIAGDSSIGSPVDNALCVIVNPYGNPVPPGTAGELWIGGEGVAAGYLNRPEQTADRFVEWYCAPLERAVHVYKTGDLARLDQNGQIQWLGRLDRQVKIRGFRIELEEIESVLVSHPEVLEAAVSLGETAVGEATLHAFVVQRRDLDKSSLGEGLRRFTAGRLPSYMVPARFIFLEKIPRNPNGKADRSALRIPKEPQKVECGGVKGDMETIVTKAWSEVLGIEAPGLDDNYFEAGGNSLNVIRLRSALQKALRRDLNIITLFQYPTVRGLARYLGGAPTSDKNEDSAPITPAENREIAVVGMSGRFPGADNIHEFWGNLKNGVECITFFTPEELTERGVSADLLDDPRFIPAKGVLEGREYFDAPFFGYAPKEALTMDPQVRLFHECAWQALEDAGVDPYNSEASIGLYAGATLNPLWLLRPLQDRDAPFAQQWEALQYCDKDYLCSRVSYKLNLDGPVVSVSTACSTSLAAVDLACRGLLMNQCDMALAGGVAVTFQDQNGYLYQEGMIMSPDGHCRAFGYDAGGTVGGNGAGAVVLEPLERAMQNRRRIYALVKGSAVNNDAAVRAGFTAPSVNGQSSAIKKALAAAGVNPSDIGYVEAHGTGTKLGDPIEIAALTQAFGEGLKQTAAIGSVKTNIGHLDAAAGIAGFIKTALSLFHGFIPPSLHAQKTNGDIDFDSSPFYVNTGLEEWDKQRRPWRAGVSSFGIGGTNVHVILEEAPQKKDAGECNEDLQRNFHLLPLSAKTPEALARTASNLAAHLEAHPYLQLPSVAYTMQTGRSPFGHRQVVVANNLAEAAESLASSNRVMRGSVPRDGRSPEIVFLFPGQGAQYLNMGRDLYRGEPLFRDNLDRCFDILRPVLGFDLQRVLYPAEQSPQRDGEAVDITSTAIAQPLLVSIEYALARMLMDWGIEPAAMMGHSIGEYTAACVSGVLTLEDTLTLVTARGRLMQELPGGVMLSVALDGEQLEDYLDDTVSLAAVNSSGRSVLSGTAEALARVEAELAGRGIETRRLHTSHAFHSHMMEPARDAFLNVLDKIALGAPQIPYISNLTGDWIDKRDLEEADYWWRHLRNTVRFADGIDKCLQLRTPIFLEIGPGNALNTFVRQHRNRLSGAMGLALNMMRHPREKMSDDYLLQKQLGMLWLHGQTIDWAAVNKGNASTLVSLPTYPFQRQKFPLDVDLDGMRQEPSPQLKKKSDISQWFYVPSWERSVMPDKAGGAAQGEGPVLILASNTALDERLLALVRKDHCRAVQIKAGNGFHKESIDSYRVCPSSRQDFRQLLDELEKDGLLPRHILHLWGLDPNGDPLDNGFRSLSFLAVAIGRRSSDDVKLVAVTRDVYEVNGSESSDPSRAAILGPLKVIPLEIPSIRCIHVDVDRQSLSPRPKDLAHRLITELFAKHAETVIAYRGAYRWTQSYLPHVLEDIDSTVLKQNGTYLITGGLGRIGLLLARHLTRRCQARLMLTGRSSFPVRATWDRWLADHHHQNPISRKIRLLLQLEAEGAEIAVFQADAGNRRAMNGVVRTIEETYGRLDGVIHAAGIIGDDNLKSIDEWNEEDLEIQFRAKCKGAEVLATVLEGWDYDFCLLMSSTASVLGGLGFTVYAAANSVMDALAHQQNRGDGPRWISVNFDGWRDEDADEEASPLGSSVVSLSITPDEGCRAFERIVGAMPCSQLIQSSADLNLRLRLLTTPSTESRTPEESAAGHLCVERPHLSTPYVEPRAGDERRLAEVWRAFFALEAVGAADDFFELGGDSLKATILLAQMHQKAGIQVPLKDFFKNPTIEGIVQLIGDRSQNIYEDIQPVEKRECYQLSSAQKRLFFLDRFEEIGASYNMPTIVRLDGPLDRDRLNEAFRLLIQRHESLRTSFLMLDTEPAQRIHDFVEFRVELLEAPTDGVVRHNQLVRDFLQPFDLTKPPLLRAGLLKEAPNRHILIVDIHHIVGDGTSMTNLVRDFALLYVGDRPAPLKIRYKDFCYWQNRIVNSDVIKKQRDYWLDRFSGDIPRLHLPTQRPRPAVFDFSGRSIHFSIPVVIGDAVKETAAGTNTTLFMNLLAAFYLLLYKYTGQEDIVVGASVAGRQHADLQGAIGMFVNALAMRARVDGNLSYQEFLARVKQVCVEGFENQDVQFEELVDRLDPKRDPARNPLFDVALVVQNFEHAQTRMGDVTLEPLVRESVTSKFDLTFFVVDMDGELHVEAEFYAAIFDMEFIRQLARHYVAIVGDIARRPNVPLGEVRMVDGEEKQRLLDTWNQSERDYSRNTTVVELFFQQVEQTPDRVAVEGEDGVHLTYRQLREQAGRLAAYLKNEACVRRQEPVGIMLDNSPESLMAIFGVLSAGAAYVPLDPSTPEERLVLIFDDAGISTLISSKKYIRRLNRLQWECPSLRTFLCLDSYDATLEEEAESSQLMDQGLWDYVARTAEDDVMGGGWTSSYTGESFSRLEMDEYAENVIHKLEPLLHKETRVLEIGCASGITMYRVAPQVAFYYGTDLSAGMIEMNRRRVEGENIGNIALAHVPAHQIGTIDEKDFDLIIINSVIQSFHGHNYLRRVVRQAVDLLAARGSIFIGDVMDQDLKRDLIRDLEDFKAAHAGEDITTKTDWSTELFVSRDFFRDLRWEMPDVVAVDFSPKRHTVSNELTKFRYDALLRIDKNRPSQKVIRPAKCKQQHDLRLVEQACPIDLPCQSSSRDLAYIIYTSGTTGRPKGVMVEHQSLVNYICWGQEAYSIGDGCLFPLYTTLSFDLTVTSVYLPLLSGGGIKVYSDHDGRDRFPLERVLAGGIVDLVKATPSHLKMFLAMDIDIPLSSRFRGFIVGGEELESGLAADIHRRFGGKVAIFNEYGPTEATVGCMIYRFDPQLDVTGGVPIGGPVANSSIVLLDPQGGPVPLNGVGELYIGGECLAHGYLNRPELTHEKFVVGERRLYRSGDLASRRRDGVVEYWGRSDGQVKIRGYRIELSEVENRLLEHDSVKEAAVMARQSQEGDPCLCAYIVVGERYDEALLRDYSAQRLPAYMIPQHIVLLEQLPVTVSGKLDARRLPEPEGAGRQAGYEPPRNPLESALCDIWGEVLGIPVHHVGVNDDFFTLGGHSLRATVVIARIHRELNVKVPLGELFQRPTIEALALYITDASDVGFDPIPIAEKRDYYPLSSAQKRLFFLHRFKASSLSYNMPAAVKLEGKLDRKRLQEALALLVRRHESLRTSFQLVGGEPVQRVWASVNLQLEDLPAGDPDAAMKRFIRPFDLERAPLLRAGVQKMAEGHYILFLDMHHIIGDGVSIANMVRDVSLFYAGETPDALPIQYKDFVLRRKVDNLDYWLEILAGDLPVLALPTDFQRPETFTYRGAVHKMRLSPELTVPFKQMASQSGATVFMALMAVLQAVLHRYTGQEDIIAGTGVAGRRHQDLQPVVGMFVNSLPIRCFPRRDLSFSALLEQVKQTCVTAFEHQDVQFEELVERLNVPRDLARNPVFDVCLINQNYSLPHLSLADLEVSPVEFDAHVSKLDMTLYAVEVGDELVVDVEYCTDLFLPETVDRLTSHFERVLAEVAVDPDVPLKDIPLLADEELHRLIDRVNDTKRDYQAPESLHAMFQRQVELTPDRAAIVDEAGDSFSYIEFDRLTSRLARLLIANGVGRGDLVGLSAQRSIQMVAAIFAILKAGAAYLPIDPGYPAERITYILEDSDAKIVLCDDSSIQADLAAREVEALSLRDCLEEGAGAFEERGLSLAGAEDPAYVLYTSGSTGRPKGVLVNHGPAVNIVCALQELYPVGEGDVYLFRTPYIFDISVTELFGWFMGGGTLLVPLAGSEKDPRRLPYLIRRGKVTHMNVIPSQFQVLLETVPPEELKDLGKLRYIFSGGEAVLPETVRRFRELNRAVKMENMYGPTEATVYAAYYSLDQWRGIGSVPIGSPLANTGIYVLDEDLRLQPFGVVGELCIGGMGLARGYLNRPELTDVSFVGGGFDRAIPCKRIYRTGDLARWLPDGTLEFLGRRDHQVKIRGFRIELGEIEGCLLSHPAVREVVVAARPFNGDGDVLCAYILPGKSLKQEEIRDYCSGGLAEYMVPSYFVFVDHIPRTANGKVDRKALPAPMATSGHHIVAPRSEVERLMTALWLDVLGLGEGDLGIDCNFFKAGGHSLRAAVLAARLAAEFAVDVPLEQIFKTPTVRGICKYIRSAEQSSVTAPVPVEKRDYYPLTPAQTRLYVLQQMDPAGTVYNLPQLFSVQRKLDVRRLADVFRRLLKRHSVFRTSFVTVEETPVQRVSDIVDFEVEVWDKGDIEVFTRPFDLSRAPLLRVGIAEEEDGGSLLLVDLHHIIGDGVSLENLIAESIALYSGEDVAELPLQFHDYAVWRHEREDAVARQGRYWEELYSRRVPVLDLPTDFPRQGELSRRGDCVTFELPALVCRRLNQLASASDATVFMVLLAAFGLMLSNVCREDDVVVGTPVAGRTHAALQPLVGMFVNTLPLRMTLDRRACFGEFLADVRRQALAAFENQEFPFEELLERVEVLRDTSRNPLFDVLFALQNTGDGFKAAPASSLLGDVQPLGPLNPTAKFDLTLTGYPLGDRLLFKMKYRAALFQKETIEMLTGYFQQILAAVVEDSLAPIGKIQMAQDRVQVQMKEALTGKGKDHPMDMTLAQLFRRQAQAVPHEPALMDSAGQQTLTYSELDRMSDHVRDGLLARGVEWGAIVAVETERSPFTIIGILGILKAGAAYMPLDPDFPQERVRFMMEDSGAALTLGSQMIRKLLETGASTDVDREENDGDASDLAYVIYTSGTTGRPKGVMVQHNQAVNTVSWFIDNYELKTGSRVLHMSELTFDPSVNQVFATLLSGGTLVLVDKETLTDTGKLRDIIRRYRIEILNFVPQLLGQLLDDEEILPSVRLVLSGGEALTDTLKENILGRGYRLFNQYGPTETSIDALAEECSLCKTSIGRPIHNTKIVIVDHENTPVPPLVAGELLIAGNGVARGYMNRPELTAEKFVYLSLPGEDDDARYYRTGDLARVLADGRVEFLGRLDRQVKIRGFRVELTEIENQLLAHAQLSGTAVVDCGDGLLAAYVVSGEEINADEIKEFLAGRLPVYMIPPFIQMVPAIPRNSSGKVDIAALPEPDFDAQNRAQPPQTATETRLAGLWSPLMGISEENIGASSDFFALGGHSLKAMTLVARIKREWGVDLKLRDLFAHSSLQAMARTIDNLKPEADSRQTLRPAEKRDCYPLSPAQRRLYVLQQMDPASTVYNMPEWIALDEPLRQERLLEVLEILSHRHSGLRTSFIMRDGEPVQRICDRAVIQVEQWDASAADFIRPFDLATAPLMRAGIMNGAGGNGIILMDIHHIVCDGVSMQRLSEEFKALVRDPAAELPLIELQYHDFALWLQSGEANRMVKRQEAFWLEEFSGELPVLELPLDFPRPNVREFSGGNLTFTLDTRRTAGLIRLAGHHDATVYMVMLAVFSCWLSHLSGQRDVVVGTPVAGRGDMELENIVGMFVNTLALRLKPADDSAFTEFLAAVKETALQAFDHQDYPFEELVDKLSIQRDTARNPLFDVMFGFQTAEDSAESSGDKVILENPVSRFDLSLNCLQRGGEIQCYLEYSTALFKEESMCRYAGHFACVVDSILDDPGLALATVNCLPEVERRQLTVEFNDTTKDYHLPANLAELLSRRARITPDAVAVREPRRDLTLTYAELEHAAGVLAKDLESQGIGGGDIVAFSLERSAELVAAVFGILKAGAAYLPLDPGYPAERVSYILNDSGATLLEGFDIHDLLDGDTVQESGERLSSNRGQAHDPAYVIYTSGSTGRPKGVVVEHAAALNLIYSLQDAYPMETGDVYLLKTAVVFDVSVSELFGWIPGGATLAILPPEQERDPQAMMDIIDRFGVTHVNFVPSMFQAFCEILKRMPRAGFKRLRYVFLAGEALIPSLVSLARTLLPEVRLENLYGPTEATVYASGYSLAGWREHGPVPIGKPLANVRLYVMGANHELKGIGIPGELCVAGAGLAREYLNRPDLSRRQFVHVTGLDEIDPAKPVRVYRTGDLARMMPCGNIEFLGRIDHQVKIRGFRIELGEIENRLLEHPLVGEVSVLARHDDTRGTYLCAYTVSHEPVTGDQLRSYLKDYVPAYMIPAFFIRLEEFPRTGSGKIDKHSLPLPGGAAVENDQLKEPKNPTQRDLLEIWQSILGDARIGVGDNFFDIGGNSLLLLKMHAAIDERFPGKVRVVDLFNLTSIVAIGDFIDQEGEPERKRTLPQLLLPESYFTPPSTLSHPDYLSFSVNGGVYRELKDFAGGRDLMLEEMLLGIYLYLFSEITQQDIIGLPAVIRHHQRIDHLTMDVSKADSILHLFEMVKETLDTNKHSMSLPKHPWWNGGSAATGNQIRAVFYLKKLLKSGARLTGDADLALEVDEKQDRLDFYCEYSSRLKGEKVEEIASMYVEMLEALVRSLTDGGEAEV